jgi:hypothetical protein
VKGEVIVEVNKPETSMVARERDLIIENINKIFNRLVKNQLQIKSAVVHS